MEIINDNIIKKNNNIVITEIEDENGNYTKKGLDVQNAILQGEASGRYHMAIELGFKALDMLEMIQLETGLSIEELMYLKNREDMD